MPITTVPKYIIMERDALSALHFMAYCKETDDIEHCDDAYRRKKIRQIEFAVVFDVVYCQF